MADCRNIHCGLDGSECPICREERIRAGRFTIGERIQALRGKTKHRQPPYPHWSLSRIAKELGVEPQKLAAWEHDLEEVPLWSLMRICLLFNVPLEYFTVEKISSAELDSNGAGTI